MLVQSAGLLGEGTKKHTKTATWGLWHIEVVGSKSTIPMQKLRAKLSLKSPLEPIYLQGSILYASVNSQEHHLQRVLLWRILDHRCCFIPHIQMTSIWDHHSSHHQHFSKLFPAVGSIPMTISYKSWGIPIGSITCSRKFWMRLFDINFRRRKKCRKCLLKKQISNSACTLQSFKIQEAWLKKCGSGSA